MIDVGYVSIFAHCSIVLWQQRTSQALSNTHLRFDNLSTNFYKRVIKNIATMALKNLAGALLRTEVRKQLYGTHSLRDRVYQTTRVTIPHVRFASNDNNPDVVVDCSGSACAPIKRGAFCAPGTEEYCIAGHMPGEEEYSGDTVGAHSTVTPGQYSVLSHQDADGKEGKRANKASNAQASSTPTSSSA